MRGEATLKAAGISGSSLCLGTEGPGEPPPAPVCGKAAQLVEICPPNTGTRKPSPFLLWAPVSSTVKGWHHSTSKIGKDNTQIFVIIESPQIYRKIRRGKFFWIESDT